MVNKVGIIGLGVVGRRTLATMSAHEDFTVTRGWDPDPAPRAQVAADHGEVKIGADAEEVVAARDVDMVYVACPPAYHRDHVLAAIAARKHVFCEKPLGIDVALSRDLVERVERSGLKAAVNFVYGAAPGGALLEERLRAGALGEVLGVDVRLHFALWPRPWQARARWLEKREQGGFVREVLSHFVFLIGRLLGSPTIAKAEVRYPSQAENLAETHVTCALACDGVPVSVSAMSGGVGPDQVELTVWGSQSSYRLYDWYKLALSEGGGWSELPIGAGNPGLEAYTRQLDHLAAMLAGEPHTLPDFREALAVQELIEALLRR